MQPPWKLASAIVRGRDHVRLDLPCQDALEVSVVPSDAGQVLVAAVSDGAGSARLADVGSRVSTEVALAWLAGRAASLSEATDPRVLATELLEAVRVAIAVEAKAHEAPLGDFACTLLVALVSNNVGFFAQVGDGAIVIAHGPESAGTAAEATDADAEPTPAADLATPAAPELVETPAIAATPTGTDTENAEKSVAAGDVADPTTTSSGTEPTVPSADSSPADQIAAADVPAPATPATVAPTSADTASDAAPEPASATAPPAASAPATTAPAAPTPHAPPYRCVFWPAKGEHANETVFVTSNSAARHLEAVLIRADITDVALFTDGIERLALDFATQTAFPAFFGPFFGAVRGLPPGDEVSAALSAELQAFLDSPRVHDATSDDRALVLASRQGT